MPSDVVFDPEFTAWFNVQVDDFQDAILQKLSVLKVEGPQLGRPLVDHIKGSAHANMKELRFDHENMVVRILFAFDLKRRAYVLLGGDKSNDKKWYVRHIPIADARMTAHLLLQNAEIEANKASQGKGKR